MAQIEKLQDVLQHIGVHGHRHHVSVTPGRVMAPVYEALRYYLGFEVALPQKECTNAAATTGGFMRS